MVKLKNLTQRVNRYKDGVGGYKIEGIAGIDIKSDQQCEIFIHTNTNKNKSFTFNDCVF